MVWFFRLVYCGFFRAFRCLFRPSLCLTPFKVGLCMSRASFARTGSLTVGQPIKEL
jgi:hypothetical protein